MVMEASKEKKVDQFQVGYMSFTVTKKTVKI